MKTRHAAPFLALILAGTALGALSFGGCSSSSDAVAPVPVADSAPVDTGKADTKPLPDTGSPDTKPAGDSTVPTCDQDLPTDFKCVAPTKSTGSTACTEAMLQEFATACISADLKVPTTCAAWKTANAACSTCVEAWSIAPSIIPGKVIPDRDKCYWSVFDDKCNTAVNCYFSCGDAVCNACDQTKGTGTKPTTSEYDDCWTAVHFGGSASKPKGRCYDLASKTAKADCFAGPFDLNPCIISELYTPTGAGGKIDGAALKTEAIVFLRGACRDNANWKDSASAGDAGTGG